MTEQLDPYAILGVALAPASGRGVVTFVPVTTSVDRIHPFQVLLPAAETGLSLDSKAQAEQVRCVVLERIGRRCGVLTPTLAQELDQALRVHLSL